ncbi:hypothetical protein [Kineococcus arenarius]|uniref:hypothetical protein n=1 Tax=unclassified Kineococcus TaxID=2621656 RepID=UPI003D7EBB1C
MADDGTQASFGERPDRTGRAVLVVPVNDVERLATLCVLAGFQASVVPVRGVGCVVVPDRASEARSSAVRLSRLLRGADVVLLRRDEGATDAAAWRGGVRGEVDADAALLLASWPAAVGQLLSGELDPAAGGTPTGADSRARAAWKLLRGRGRWG